MLQTCKCNFLQLHLCIIKKLIHMEIQRGCVYFFRHVGLSPVKIGYSENESPMNRFFQFKTYAPYGSEILGFIMISEAKLLESDLHRKYASKRLNGEWFDISEEEVKKEIDFYTNIADIKDRNEFQIAWALEIQKKKENSKIDYPISKDRVYETFKKRYLSNKNLNKSQECKLIGVTRKTVQLWCKKIDLEYET